MPLFRVPQDDAGQAELEQLKIDQHPTDAAVAVAEGVDGFEFEMEAGDLVEEPRFEIRVVGDGVLLHHQLDVLRRRGDMGSDAHVLAGLPVAPGDPVIDAIEKHPVQVENQVAVEFADGGARALVLHHPGQVFRLE